MLKGCSADLDGDALNGKPLTIAEVANINVSRLRKAKTLEDKIKLMYEITDINKSKFRAMSLRRKKIAIKKYSFAFGYYNTKTGNLVSSKRRHEKHVESIPLVLKFTEKVGKPFTDMMDAWVKMI